MKTFATDIYLIPDPDLTLLMLQLGTKAGPGVLKAPVSAAAGARKPLSDSGAATNNAQQQAAGRKVALGKGVPPPVPPNKPSVPVKKTELSKRSDSVVEGPGSSHPVVAGLQGLKFGISLSSSESSKGIKPLSESNVPAKKFFNNIESKS